ncbi:pilus assembly protein PilP [Neisseria animalis]|uniref:Pilin assembly protein n=1 Tax=Neisseria animalis TaxID=492 RepID=A0A5P3MRV9_NEIAN|nr:pilus assembly protein PilP [Neisseria animalis]QEY24268.1 pilin assembly protein [Neisseria animalis]ROW32326.1 pilin assembly protein [Neisseria animalis]VEE06657.1 PilP protein [Neisseria animalis]
MNKIFLLSCLLTAACSHSNDDLKQWTEQTRAAAKADTPPFEAAATVAAATYTAPPHSGPNAFDSRRLQNRTQGLDAPNPNRRKEALEAFDLNKLRYVGILESNGKTSGYIEADGHVYTVTAGNYIGRDHGRIRSITAEKILLTELVEGSDGNWIYRSAELTADAAEASEHNAKPQQNQQQPRLQNSPTGE